MPTLDVEGPYDVPHEVNDRGAKHISAEDGRDFFEEFDGLAEERGCYLFAIRSRGLRAAYVGKATRGFGQEAFATDKLQKYNTAVHHWPHGTPVLLFVVTPPGVRSARLISEVEKYLLRSAKRAWHELLNVHHAGEDAWDISGVTAPHAGRRSDAESELMRLLGLEAP